MIAGSVSVQNLGNLVKQIANGTLKNNEYLIQFQRMMYDEELTHSLKTLFELRDGEHKENDGKVQQVEGQLFSYRYKSQHNSSTLINGNNDGIIEEHLEILQVDTLPARNNEKSLILNDENITNHDQHMEIITNDSSKQLHQTFDGESVVNHAKVIEIWSNSIKRFVTNKSRSKKNEVSQKFCRHSGDNEVPGKQLNREKLSFENWTKHKTIAYRNMLERKKMEMLRLEAMKRNKNDQQAHKKQKLKQQQNRKLLKKHMETIKRANVFTPFNQIKEKQIVKGTHGFDTSKKLANIKYDKDRRATMAVLTRKSNRINVERKAHATRVQLMENVTFDSWLNQLNRVLHEKYLRERRHLVRSFYCQPVYYGDITLCAR